MYTVPAWRRRGYGRALLAELEVAVVRAGRQQLLLETGVHNSGALALYEAMGYRPIESYIAGRSLDVGRAFTRQL
jgi:predicted GNAT family acetyltransferase